MKRALKLKSKAFSIIFQVLSVVKTCFRYCGIACSLTKKDLLLTKCFFNCPFEQMFQENCETLHSKAT